MAINDAGQITGYGVLNGQTRAFLLTPVPEPPAMAYFTFIVVMATWKYLGRTPPRRTKTEPNCLVLRLRRSRSTRLVGPQIVNLPALVAVTHIAGECSFRGVSKLMSVFKVPDCRRNGASWNRELDSRRSRPATLQRHLPASVATHRSEFQLICRRCVQPKSVINSSGRPSRETRQKSTHSETATILASPVSHAAGAKTE